MALPDIVSNFIDLATPIRARHYFTRPIAKIAFYVLKPNGKHSERLVKFTKIVLNVLKNRFRGVLRGCADFSCLQAPPVQQKSERRRTSTSGSEYHKKNKKAKRRQSTPNIMLQQNTNKSGGGSSKPPSPEIITYSPSKFMTRVGPGENTYTTSSHLRTHTHMQAATGTAAATVTTKTNKSTVVGGAGGSTSYYVVKAGSLGSAASMTGSVKVSTPPKAGTVMKSPSLAVTSPATPTESVMIK